MSLPAPISTIISALALFMRARLAPYEPREFNQVERSLGESPIDEEFAEKLRFALNDLQARRYEAEARAELSAKTIDWLTREISGGASHPEYDWQKRADING